MPLMLFDLGGVLIELTGIPKMIEWTGNMLTEAEIWHRWMHCEAVKQYESGKITKEQFAEGVVSDFMLQTEPIKFLEHFGNWPSGFYPGTTEFLTKLKKKYKVACLSNTNPIHWEIATSCWNIEQYFDDCHLSFLMKSVKPDNDIFEKFLQTEKTPAGQIYFFDDNLVNIETAQRFGINAFHVKGFEETRKKMHDLKLIDKDF